MASQRNMAGVGLSNFRDAEPSKGQPFLFEWPPLSAWSYRSQKPAGSTLCLPVSAETCPATPSRLRNENGFAERDLEAGWNRDSALFPGGNGLRTHRRRELFVAFW